MVGLWCPRMSAVISVPSLSFRPPINPKGLCAWTPASQLDGTLQAVIKISSVLKCISSNRRFTSSVEDEVRMTCRAMCVAWSSFIIRKSCCNSCCMVVLLLRDDVLYLISISNKQLCISGLCKTKSETTNGSRTGWNEIEMNIHSATNYMTIAPSSGIENSRVWIVTKTLRFLLISRLQP